MSGILLLVLALAFFIYRGYNQKKKDNLLLAEQKTLIEKEKIVIEGQSKIITEKNQEIGDSIRYARQIQRAMLPNPKIIEKHLPQSFGLYKPRDVVSGDFYYFSVILCLFFLKEQHIFLS